MGNEKTSTKYKILQSLRQAKKTLSGESLAREHEISRTSVWKAVQALQEAGYKIESMGSGYVLSQDLKDSIFPFEFGSEEKYFTHFTSTESTMLQARKIAEQEEDFKSDFPFRIVTADVQTKGRGQNGKSWKTTKGSLAFTLVTKEKLPVHLSNRFVVAAQIALCTSLNKLSNKNFFLRWPNDIWTKDGKVAGILNELFATGFMCSWQNLGIGVNISSAPKLEKADCILDSTENTSRKDLLLSFCKEFKNLLQEVKKQDSLLCQHWNSLCMDTGKKIQVKQGGSTYTFNGINAYGMGLLSSDKQEEKFLIPGSDSYIK